MQADSNSTTTPNVTYMRKATDLTSSDIVVPIFSIVVNIDNGKVSDVAWDNGCWDCTSMCYLDKINVNSSQSICRINPCNTTQNGSTTACDPKIYVSWIGTDSNGNHMNSAGSQTISIFFKKTFCSFPYFKGLEYLVLDNIQSVKCIPAL